MPLLSSYGLSGGLAFRGGAKALESFNKIFTYTGGIQTFSAPSETTELTAYVFGPGGGSEADQNSNGGAGGYSVGTINNTGGATFKIVVGGGGGPGTQNNGSGGGYSGVFTNAWNGNSVSTDHNASIILAGGGGGSGDNNRGNPHGGGAGGGNNGQNGATPSGGGGGTQNGGGQYRNNGNGNCTAPGPQGNCRGAQLRGGIACGGQQNGAATGWPNRIYGGQWASAAGRNGCNSGGGGAGYYGGAGGGGSPNSSSGGGGSGYIGGHPNHPVNNANTYTGSGRDLPPQATSSPYWPGNQVGRGGIRSTNHSRGQQYGGDGRVVIEYEAYEPVG